jgi:maleylacetate reductase
VIPEAVTYDPEPSLGLPAATSVTSGASVIAQAVEGLYARERSPVIDLMAQTGASLLIEALPQIVAGPQDIDARERAFCGSWLCGTVLGHNSFKHIAVYDDL